MNAPSVHATLGEYLRGRLTPATARQDHSHLLAGMDPRWVPLVVSRWLVPFCLTHAPSTNGARLSAAADICGRALRTSAPGDPALLASLTLALFDPSSRPPADTDGERLGRALITASAHRVTEVTTALAQDAGRPEHYDDAVVAVLLHAAATCSSAVEGHPGQMVDVARLLLDGTAAVIGEVAASVGIPAVDLVAHHAAVSDLLAAQQ